MGYSTSFTGQFNLNRPLDDQTYQLLVGLATSRRMKRDPKVLVAMGLGTAEELGIDGEFFVNGAEFKYPESIIDHDSPPQTQPGLHCQWIPTPDRLHIVWDGQEKFYHADQWLEYLANTVLAPRNYMMNGLVYAQGENPDDSWRLVVVNNMVKVHGASDRVFVVHGRDEAIKYVVTRYLEKLGLDPVILHEQPNKGRTIIEKVEEHSDVDFAVILLTPDDVGALQNEQDALASRARQNVVFEWGYFLGVLGRKRVCAVYSQGVELPSDLHGILRVEYDGAEGGWRLQLAKEMKATGIDIDLNRIL